jgi:hypothetical protein
VRGFAKMIPPKRPPAKKLRRFFSRPVRSATIAIALAGYLIAATGLPLPILSRKDHSEPFPCMDHACGCASASQCWHNCCCTTPAERLAWAKQHGVEPPLSVLVAVGRQTDEFPAAKACCTAKHRHDDHDELHDSAPPERSGVAKQQGKEQLDFVSISALRQCSGLAPLWSFLAAAPAPPAIVQCDFEWNPVGWVRPSSERASSLAGSPPIPPPRG